MFLRNAKELTVLCSRCTQDLAMSRWQACMEFMLQARALPSRTFPQVFLHHMMGMCSGWEPPQRLLVHSCLITLLPVATDDLKDTQLHGLLSTIWHEVSLSRK